MGDIKDHVHRNLYKKILEDREAPPVSSFTLESKKGVSAFPVMFLSLRLHNLT